MSGAGDHSGSDSEWYGFMLAVMYAVASISITFFNKAVLSLYAFPYSQTLTLAQVIFSIAFLYLLRKFKYVDFPDWSNAIAWQVLPLSLCFLTMVVSGLASLALVNIPMFNALRRMATLMVIIGEFLILGKRTEREEILSVIVMSFGALVAGSGDITFDPVGYFISFISCLCTAAYLIYIAKVTKLTNLNTFGLMYYNNVISLPVLCLLVYLLEADQLQHYEGYSNVGFQVFFVLSSVAGFILNYLIFMCSKVNSPLTTSITGQLKVIATTLVGIVSFGGVDLNFTFGMGLAISTLASIWYSAIKYHQMQKRTQERK